MSGRAQAQGYMSKVRQVALFRGLPAELRDWNRWVVWRFEQIEGKPKPNKVPYEAWMKTLKRASSTDPTSWGTFGVALTIYQLGEFDGLMFALGPETGLVFVDLDEVRDPSNGYIEGWALQVAREIDSYTEVSVSGRGIHILAKGELPEGRRRDGKIEMYSEGRFVVMTGRVIDLSTIGGRGE